MSIIPDEETIIYAAWKILTIWINVISNVTRKPSFQRGELDGDFLKHRFIDRSRIFLFGKELIIQKI